MLSWMSPFSFLGPELELSRFIFRVGNHYAVPECVSLALPEMRSGRPGHVVREGEVYVHSVRERARRFFLTEK